MPSDSKRDRRPVALVARTLFRRARHRLRVGPMYRWRFVGKVPDRVCVAPPDLRLADAQIAHDIYSSRFPLAGHLVDSGGTSPFQIEAAHESWKKALHSFRWLRHLSAAGTDLAGANARALISDWIDQSSHRLDGPGWDAGTTAKRVIAWLQHSTLILAGAEVSFYRTFLNSLARQIRYLRVAGREMDHSKDRLRARIAIAFASLSLPSSPAAIRNAARFLDADLNIQILPDGGHISRNPLAVMDLLADLLPLRQTYANQGETPPPALVRSIDRMLLALRFFRHADGSIARFNGMGMTINERVHALLRHDDTSAQPPGHAPHSGYDRLAQGQTVVIMDTGVPPPPELSCAAHAGCLSFELSSGRSCVVVNCGVDTRGNAAFRPLARATAAHSTATLDDTSQGRFSYPARLHRIIGAPLLDGPASIRRQRHDEAASSTLVAGHDAYVARFGMHHERQLKLADKGNLLIGQDRFPRMREAGARDRQVTAAVRFHIHPDIQLFSLGQSAIGLASRSGALWMFECPDIRPVIEESIFFATAGGPRKTSQIVLNIPDARDRQVTWRLRRQSS